MGALAVWSLAASPAGSEANGARSLRICVDTVGTTVSLPEARLRLERVMRSHVELHARYLTVGFQPGAWSIVEKCPMAPTLLTSGERALKNGGSPSLRGLVNEGSGFDLFVFVVPQSEIARMFGELPYQIAGQELMCSGDSCGDISNAWYVSPDILLSSELAGPANPVARGLLMGIGMDPVLPEVPRLGPQHK
jgi:hypothetical protein